MYLANILSELAAYPLNRFCQQVSCCLASCIQCFEQGLDVFVELVNVVADLSIYVSRFDNFVRIIDGVGVQIRFPNQDLEEYESGQ
jgi:hypothetical protein